MDRGKLEPINWMHESFTGMRKLLCRTPVKKIAKNEAKKYANAFTYTEHQNELDKPLHWKKSRKIFVNSMSDLFHENATDSFIDAIFSTMLRANHHIYQVLTKRPERMKDFVKKWLDCNGCYDRVPDHIWLGTSVENQQVVNRIKTLQEIPSIKFISFEPLLGMISADLSGVDWVIAGGESGDNYRQVQTSWIRQIRSLCNRYKIPFFFKQWGGIYPKAQGRTLDGKTYDQFPKIIHQH